MLSVEQRGAARSYAIKPGRIMCGDLSLACVIFELSATGMRVCLAADAIIPERVILQMPNGALRAARRVWQKNDEVGFEFLTSARDLATPITVTRTPTYDLGVILGLALRDNDALVLTS